MKTKNKKQIIQAFLGYFENELSIIETSAKAARNAATHDESKAEDMHDTRAVEASYLAGAQAARALELKQVILDYKLMMDSLDERKPEGHMMTIAVGSLITLQPHEKKQPHGKKFHYFLALKGGGASVEVNGNSYSVLTPSSPLGEAIMGAKAGDHIETDSKGGHRSYEVLSVE